MGYLEYWEKINRKCHFHVILFEIHFGYILGGVWVDFPFCSLVSIYCILLFNSFYLVSHPELVWNWSKNKFQAMCRVRTCSHFIYLLSLFSSVDFWRLVDRMHISAKCRPAGSHTGAPELSIKGLNYHPQKLQINIYPSVQVSLFCF